MMQQLVPYLFGNRMSGCKHNMGGERHVYLRMQAMAEPASADIRHFFYLRHMGCGMANFVNNVRIDAVEHP